MHTTLTRPHVSSFLTALGLAAVLLLRSAASASAGPIASAPALPIGTWQIVANGHSGQLTIAAVSSTGSVLGSAFGKPLRGWWDGFAQKITFELGAAPSGAVQFYTGYLTLTAEGSSSAYRLAGFFEAFVGGGGVAQRSIFGWTASTITSAAVGMVEGPVLSPANTVLFPSNWTMYGPVCCPKLHLLSVDAQGNLSGAVIENSTIDKIQGFWDSNQKKLTFIRFTDPQDPTKLQVFTGYQLGAGLSLSFAGTTEILDETAQRTVQGWYAVLTQCAPGIACQPSGEL